MSAQRVISLWAASDLESTVCWKCGLEFAMTTEFVTLLRKNKTTFYCPNGHAAVFAGPTPDQRRIAELERQVATEKAKAERAEMARKWTESSLNGARIATGKAKAAKRRLEHRVACGVCPHCQRTFKQLAAHMKTKHPAMRGRKQA